MGVQQEKIQLDIQVTDETRSFAKAMRETSNLRNEFKEAEKDVRKNAKAVADLEKELMEAAKTGKETTDIEKKLIKERDKLTESTAKLNLALKQTVESGKGFQGIDLSNVAPRMLETRLTQINSLLKQLPASIRESSPEAQALVREHQAIEKQIVAQKKALQGVKEATKDVERDSLGFLGKLVIGAMAAQRAMELLMQPTKLASEIESTKIALETMLQSKVKAQKMINDVIKMAATTPFETTELVNYTKQLLAMGVESQRVLPNLSMLGDIAAGVGKDKLGNITLAFGQVAAKTKLAGGELKQFVEAGVPLVKALADMLKKSEAEIYKMSESGQIKFKDVEKALQSLTSEGGKFYGLMAKQSQTVEGLTSTMKDNFDLVKAAFGEGLNEKLKTVLNNIINLQNGTDREQMRDWGRAVGDVVQSFITLLPYLVKAIAYIGAFKAINGTITLFGEVKEKVGQFQEVLQNGLGTAIKNWISGTTAATTAQTGLNTAVKTNPIGLYITVALAAGEALFALYEKMTALSEIEISVADGIKNVTANTKEQIQQSNDLFAVAKDVTASEEQRHAAMTKILSLYPQYLGDIENETQLKGNLAKAQELVNQKILEEGFAKVKKAKLDGMASQMADVQMKLDAANEKTGGVVTHEDGTQEVVNTAADAYEAEMKRLERNYSEFSEKFDVAASKTAKSLAKVTNTSFSLVNTEIAQVQKALLGAANNPVMKAQLEARLHDLHRQKSKAIAETTEIEKTSVTKQEVDEKAQKKAQKDAKDAVKHLNDLRKIAHDETVLQYEAQSLELSARYQDKQMTKQDFDKQDIEIEIHKQEAIIKLQDSYLGRFKTYSKEWVDVMKDKQKALQEIEKAKEKQDKALNDDRKAQEEAAIFEYERQGVEYDIMLSKHLITKEEHAKRELQIEIEKNRALIAINTDFLSKFKTGSKEYLATQKAVLQEEQRIADATVKLRPKVEDVTQIGKYGEKTDFKGKNTLETRLRDAVEGGMKLETNANQRGKSIFGKDLEINEKEGQILERKVRMVLNKALELEMKKDAIRIQALKREMETNQKGTDAYEKAAKEKEKIDAQQAKNKERLHAFEQKMIAQGKQAMSEGLQLTLDILGKDAKARKENADKIKLIQSAQVTISGIAEVQKLWAGYADMPVIGQIIAGVLTAIAVGRTVMAVDKIQSTEYYDGGYTHKGSDRTAKPVLVHGNEWVAPAWQVRHPQYRPMIQALEQGRLRGYAQGGYINTTPTVSTMPNYYQNASNDKMMVALVGELAGLRSDVAHWNTNLNATVVRDTMERDAKRDAETKRSAAL
jgi:tape measure domain-containing protein